MDRPAAERVQLTAELSDGARPVALTDWAGDRGLSVSWRDGDGWAVLEERRVRSPVPSTSRCTTTAAARGRSSTPRRNSPAFPQQLRGEVTELGRILGYTPYHEGIPPTPPLDVPDGGLMPTELLTAYNVDALAAAGYTGRA